jgi:hypothetical protein
MAMKLQAIIDNIWEVLSDIRTPPGSASSPGAVPANGIMSVEVEEATYTNLVPVPRDVGGIPAGTTFSDKPISEIITMLLYGAPEPQASAPGEPSGIYQPENLAIEPGPVPSSMSFRWDSDDSMFETHVRLYDEAGTHIQDFQGISGPGEPGKRLHEAAVAGLALGGVYGCEVSSDRSSWSERHAFSVSAAIT